MKQFMITFITSLSLFQLLVAREYLVVITVLYNEKNSARIAEYKKCLEANLANPEIDKIHVLYDTVKDTDCNILHDFLLQKKVAISYIQGRPSYQACFDIANTLYPGCRIVLTNADIHFDATLGAIKKIDLFNRMVAITRRNQVDGAWYLEGAQEALERHIVWRNYFSADTWIFKSPCYLSGFDKLCLGTSQCDGLFAMKLFYNTSMSLINLSYEINAFHEHESQQRSYEENNYLEAKNMPRVPWKYISDFSEIG